MDIKFNIKGLNVIRGQIKAEGIDVGFTLTEGETLNSNECFIELLDNPAVQKLINKFTDEVSFKKQPQYSDAENKLNAIRSQMDDERNATKKVIHDLMVNQERILALLERRFK